MEFTTSLAVKTIALVVLVELLRRFGRRAVAGLRRAAAPQLGAAPVPAPIVPRSVNYHYTRQCNYACKFCFHTALTTKMCTLEEAKHGLTLLAEAGMQKINFSGGEPFLIQKGRHLGELVRFCKSELRLQSVSIVSNGSLVTREWFVEYARWLDIMAVSCDSFVDETNKTQGRALPAAHADKRTQLEIVTAVCGLCREFGVKFKLNSVVTKLSVDEDMSRGIASLCPSLVRWKVFQCLIIDGENAGAEALRDASELVISKAQFDGFVERHRAADPDVAAVLVPEDNDTMRDSYLIVDEYMRFLDNTSNAKVPSESILDVGVAAALARSGFDDDAFHRRGGVYDWSRGPVQPAGAAGAGGAVTACADPALLW